MKLELETHPGVTIIDPTFELQKTVDYYPSSNYFQPEVLVISENIKIYHVLPKQPYVNGTWTDKDVEDSIQRYFDSIDLE